MSIERTSRRLTEFCVASLMAWLLVDFVPGGAPRWICLVVAFTPLAVAAVLRFRSGSADDPGTASGCAPSSLGASRQQTTGEWVYPAPMVAMPDDRTPSAGVRWLCWSDGLAVAETALGAWLWLGHAVATEQPGAAWLAVAGIGALGVLGLTCWTVAARQGAIRRAVADRRAVPVLALFVHVPCALIGLGLVIALAA